MMALPPYPDEVLFAHGYERVEPKGVICGCPRVREDTEGYRWCCRAGPSLEERMGGTSTPASTRLDERGVPRQVHYGAGRQPWDDVLDAGWAPEFAAGNVLKYLRRDKAREHSLESARWYHARLVEMARGELKPASDVGVPPRSQLRAASILRRLYEILIQAERDLLG